MTQARNWCFTLNNPEQDGDTLLQHLRTATGFRFTVFQLEAGDRGTPHFQGYIEFTSPKRLSALQRIIPGAHFEIRKGTSQQARDYCTKEETRTAGPWSIGTPGQETQGQRTDIDRGVTLIQEGGIKRLRDEDPALYVRYSRGFDSLARSLTLPPRPEPPQVLLLFGPTGCGKTRWFYDNTDLDSAFRMPLTTGFWFDGYEGQPDVLIDDFAGAASHITLAHLLQLLDRYPIRVPVKGSFVDWIPTRIMVTTNIHPKLWYNYTNRSEHFNALARRFTRLLLWRRDSTLVQRSNDGAGDNLDFWDAQLEPRGGHSHNGFHEVENEVDQYNLY